MFVYRVATHAVSSPYVYSSTTSVNIHFHSAVGCEWEYGPCGSCSATCGSGTKSCTPVITQQPQHGGRPCPVFVHNGEPRLFECTDLLPCPPGKIASEGS